MRHVSPAVLVLAIAMAVAACSKPGDDDVAVNTISWQPDGTGYIQYRTNDSAKLSTGQYYSVGTSSEGTMSALEVSMKKVSGSPGYGIGVIFCAADSDNFYRILISAYGHYCIWKKVQQNYALIQNWTDATINVGVGAENVIKVQYNSGPDDFTVSFNGTSAYTLTDTELSRNNIRAGYYVSVGQAADESFPDTAVDARFKMSLPVVHP